MKLLGANNAQCVSVVFVTAGYTKRLKNGDSIKI